MVSAFHIHKTIAFLLNAILVGLIMYFVYKTDSDKSPVIFMVYYPALIILNLITTFVLWLLKLKQAGIYRQIIIAELIAFAPLAFIAFQF